MHRLPSENKPILTRITWNNTTRTWKVVSSDTEVLGLIARLARTMGVKADGDGGFTFPSTTELGEGNWSPDARARIEWGVSLDIHQNAPRPIVENMGGKVVDRVNIKGPEKSRGGFEQVGPIVVVKPPTLAVPDPRDTPAPTKSEIENLKPLFRSRGE
jgi:hypothetical protein